MKKGLFDIWGYQMTSNVTAASAEIDDYLKNVPNVDQISGQYRAFVQEELDLRSEFKEDTCVGLKDRVNRLDAHVKKRHEMWPKIEKYIRPHSALQHLVQMVPSGGGLNFIMYHAPSRIHILSVREEDLTNWCNTCFDIDNVHHMILCLQLRPGRNIPDILTDIFKTLRGGTEGCDGERLYLIFDEIESLRKFREHWGLLETQTRLMNGTALSIM